MKKFNTQGLRETLRRTTILTLLLGLLLQLGACSAIKLTYNHGDTVAYWWLNGYVDLDSDQKPWVRKDIDALLAWHRQTQLPDYAQLLKDAQRQLAGQPSAAEIVADIELVKKRGDTALQRALPALADLALSMRPHQLAYLDKKFKSNNDDYRKKYLRGDLDKRQKARYKKVLEQAEFWFGAFTREQEEKIRALSDAHPMNGDWQFEQRVERQKKMLAMLAAIQKDRPPREAVVGQIQQYARGMLDGPAAPEQKALHDADLQAVAQLTEALIRLTTPAQKAHAIKRLQELIDDCATLHGQAPA